MEPFQGSIWTGHEAFLERVRRSGIRVDREGSFVHEGEVVRHEGLRRALFGWLERLPDGRHVLRLDAKRFAYIDVDDTPLVVRALRWDGDDARMALSDGTDEALDPATLTVDGEGVLRCRVRGGRLEARLSNSAAAVLAERIRETASGPVLGGSSGSPRPIPRRPTPGSPR